MKKAKAIITLIIVLLIIAIIAVVGLSLKDNKSQNELPIQKIEQKQDEEKTLDSLFSEDINLKEQQEKYNNTDITLRLEVPNMFNILIVKGKDNQYYLNRDLYKKKDKKGTEYLDYRVNYNDKQLNIYGHNSKTYDIPFRKLEKFLDEDFFNKNEYVLIQTPEGRRYYKIFSLKEVDKDYDHMRINQTGDKYTEHISNFLNNTIYKRDIKYSEKSNILVFQTCSYNKKDTYYIITSIEVDKYGNIIS